MALQAFELFRVGLFYAWAISNIYLDSERRFKIAAAHIFKKI